MGIISDVLLAKLRFCVSKNALNKNLHFHGPEKGGALQATTAMATTVFLGPYPFSGGRE